MPNIARTEQPLSAAEQAKVQTRLDLVKGISDLIELFLAKFKLDEDIYSNRRTGLLTFKMPAEVIGHANLDKWEHKFNAVSRKLEAAGIKSDMEHPFVRAGLNGTVSVYKVSFTIDPLQDDFIKKIIKYLKGPQPKRASKSTLKASHPHAGGPPSA